MHPAKQEFTRLVGAMGWTKSEAARQLGVTPASVNHLMNPNHPNKPGKPTLKLLRLIAGREKPGAAAASRGRERDGKERIRSEEDLIEAIHHAPKEVRERIIWVVNCILAAHRPNPGSAED